MTQIDDAVEEFSTSSQADSAVTDRVYPWEKALVRRLMAALGDPPVQAILWNGQTLEPTSQPPIGSIHFRDRMALLKSILDPDLNLGDAYSEGRVEVHGDLVRLLEETYRAEGIFEEQKWRSFLRRHNTISTSRQNIHQHYDLGNSFYKLWLDKGMAYTCAYFPDPAMTLEDAQLAKMDHVCRKLRLAPGENVIEAGCGWGSLALHMAGRYGVKVRAFNISHEQIVYARDWAKREGLAGQVEFIEDDYRNIDGNCDAFVSVGMLEHVGIENYRELGGVIARCLAPDGRGLIHTIGRHRPAPFSRWMEARIFPGARPPSLSQMMEIFEPHDLCVLDVENLRLHYAQTLRHWLERYEQVVDQVRDMFDERFVRTWRLYLAGSIASFTSGSMQLFQVLFNRFNANNIAMTRAHLYELRS
jgi:cyclopropane-fatty-acyl-phospholipid synthase